VRPLASPRSRRVAGKTIRLLESILPDPFEESNDWAAFSMKAATAVGCET
jgi:hypothetical protein